MNLLNIYFAFEGPTAKVLNYFGNTEKAIEGLNVTRTAAGQYTCVFLTGHKINSNQQPIIQVTSSGPAGSAGICNIINNISVVFFPTYGVYPYQVTLNIETYGGAPDPAIMMVAYVQNSV